MAMATYTSVEFYLGLGITDLVELADIVNKKSAQG